MNKSILLIGDILLIVFFWLLPHFGLLPIYAYPVVLLLICWLWLRLQKKDFSTLGLTWSKTPVRSLGMAIVFAFVYFLLYYFIIGPFLTNYLHILKSNVSDYYFVRSSFLGTSPYLLLPGYWQFLLKKLFSGALFFTSCYNGQEKSFGSPVLLALCFLVLIIYNKVQAV